MPQDKEIKETLQSIDGTLKRVEEILLEIKNQSETCRTYLSKDGKTGICVGA